MGKCPKGNTRRQVGMAGPAPPCPLLSQTEPGQPNLGQGRAWSVLKVLDKGGRSCAPLIQQDSRLSFGWEMSQPVTRTGAGVRIQHHPTCPGLGFILTGSGERLEGNHRSFLGQVSKGGWGERGRAKGKGKSPSWQEFRAQSRSGNASLPLIAPGPDEFLEETASARITLLCLCWLPWEGGKRSSFMVY